MVKVHTMDEQPKKKFSEKQVSLVVLAGAVVVTGVVLKRRFRIKTAKMLVAATETAVQQWVDSNDANGLSVILLPNKLTQELVSDKLLKAVA